MKIKRTSLAGTLESSDIMITIEPADHMTITLTSSVEKQFGDKIRSVITQTLAEMGIDSAAVTAVDKGALDCTIRARVKTAAGRALEEV